MILARKFVAGREVVLGLAVFVAAFVFGNYAGDGLAFVDQLRAGKLREDIYAGLLHETAEPLHQLVQRDNVIAVVPQRRRRDRQFPGAAGRQKIGGIIGDRRVERRRFRKIRHEFGQSAGIEHGAGELVRADFASLFENVDAFSRQLGFAARFVVLAD